MIWNSLLSRLPEMASLYNGPIQRPREQLNDSSRSPLYSARHPKSPRTQNGRRGTLSSLYSNMRPKRPSAQNGQR